MELHNDEISTLDWDDPDLPQEVIDDFEVDLLGLGEHLEDTYQSIEKIEYEDFPKLFHPLLKKSVREYSKWKKER